MSDPQRSISRVRIVMAAVVLIAAVALAIFGCFNQSVCAETVHSFLSFGDSVVIDSPLQADMPGTQLLSDSFEGSNSIFDVNSINHSDPYSGGSTGLRYCIDVPAYEVVDDSFSFGMNLNPSDFDFENGHTYFCAYQIFLPEFYGLIDFDLYNPVNVSYCNESIDFSCSFDLAPDELSFVFTYDSDNSSNLSIEYYIDVDSDHVNFDPYKNLCFELAYFTFYDLTDMFGAVSIPTLAECNMFFSAYPEAFSFYHSDGVEYCPKLSLSNSMTENGYNNGYNDGYQVGYDDGISSDTSYNEGYDYGYNFGFQMGQNSVDVDRIFDNGYDNGYSNGSAIGYDSGYDDGYASGYDIGLSLGQNADISASISGFLPSILGATGDFIVTVLDFEVFGISMLTILGTFGAIFVLAMFIKMVL